MGKLFLLLKWYFKELISFQSILILIVIFDKELNQLTQLFFLRTIINGNVNEMSHYSKDFVPPYLRYISQNYYNDFSTLRIPMKEHDNIMDENN